jgi:hypothetical protein
MTGSEQSKTEAVWPSVDDDAAPEEQGGPTARAGFNYQDEIAAGFLIEMLETPALVRVHCETHDDILLVWSVVHAEIAVAEFVQVKSGEPDKLWSVADLCRREKGAAGSSLFEQSLGRDKHRETSRFRVVTVRPRQRAKDPVPSLRRAGPKPRRRGIQSIARRHRSALPGPEVS